MSAARMHFLNVRETIVEQIRANAILRVIIMKSIGITRYKETRSRSHFLGYFIRVSLDEYRK
jgi:hypothetical protein